LNKVVGLVGYALGGLPACRLLQRLGVSISRDTVLRRVKARNRGRREPKVRVLGVDDWAWRKRQHYGTMLMDLERRRVIDLVPVRSASSFANWLRSHPGVDIITRDRSSLYAEGGRQGAPGAVQILDRYHLVSNLSEAVECEIQQMQSNGRAALEGQEGGQNRKRKKLTWIEARRQRCRQARYQRYLAVVELRRQGYTQLAIAERIGIRSETVARWLNAPGFPERRIRSDRRRDQARFLQDQERGLPPSRMQFNYSAGRIAARVMKPPRTLSAVQVRHLEAFLRFCPEGHKLRKLVLQFRAVLQWRKTDKLSGWMERAVGSQFPFVAQFAKTLHRHLEAVELAISTAWNNGPLEGHVNRLNDCRLKAGRLSLRLKHCEGAPSPTGQKI